MAGLLFKGYHMRSRYSSGRLNVRRQDEQLLYDWGIIVLVRLSLSPFAICVACILAHMKPPRVHKTDVLPQEIGRVPVDAFRHESSVPEIVCRKGGDYELQDLIGEEFKLEQGQNSCKELVSHR